LASPSNNLEPSGGSVPETPPTATPAAAAPIAAEPSAIADQPSLVESLSSRQPSFLRDAWTPIPRLEIYRFHSAVLPDTSGCSDTGDSAARALFIYLPREYQTHPDQRFPVLYLNDGQNLFDERISFVPGRAWQAHCTADRLIAEGRVEPFILVGIAHAGLRRLAEYTPTRDPKHGGGEGPRYGRMLREELKPFLDRTYRTRLEPEHTGLGGSSLGALISLFLGFEHPDTFRRLALLSPSLWWDRRSILHRVENAAPRPPLRIWLDMGTEEGLGHLDDTDRLFHLLRRQGWREGVDLAYRHANGGQHCETSWAERLPEMLLFLYPRAR
jgi:predicted alpha/beta superfamily hydrolase